MIPYYWRMSANAGILLHYLNSIWDVPEVIFYMRQGQNPAGALEQKKKMW